jgi:D-alanyl-D-alanine carboxypeptidase
MKSSIADHPEVASGIRHFEAWVEGQMEYRGLPGMSVGIVYDQELIWSRGFGYADVEKQILATPQTIYRIASITKVFTSTAIMQLRDGGKLQLDDPVKKHLPWFEIRNPYPDAPPITIRHLITHSSGLPRESALPYWTDFNFPTREQMIEMLPKQEAVFPPETQWKYSNLALSLAGEVVAAVSGEPYADYIDRHILEPLEMTSTSVMLPPEHQERLATGYGRRMPACPGRPDGSREVRPFTESKGIAPAANISSTVEDLARFISLQFRDLPDGGRGGKAGGKQVLKGSTLREMHRVHWLHADWKTAFGLGFGVRRQGERVLVGHGGHVAGYTTIVSFSPAEKIGAIVLTNADDSNPPIFRDEIFNLVALAINKAVTPPAPPKQPDPAWEKYVGKYRNAWGDSRVLILDGELAIFCPTELDPKLTLAKLEPVREHTFRMICEDGYMDIGELVIFELGPDGRVARLKIGENYTWPQK